jgi:hypothetical protein
VAIDILGPLSWTDNGNKYIMVVGDYFTKWMEEIPIPDAEAKTFCRKNRFYFWCPFTNSL